MVNRVLFFAVLLTARVYGQGTFGRLTGIVQDSSGAVIPNVTVKVVNQATAIEKTAITNDHGDYEVTHLNAGTYTVSAESTGFRKFEHRDVLVQALQTVRIDVKFEVGAVGAEITVQTGAPVIETEAPVISNVKSAKELRDLPMNVLNGVVLNQFLFTVPTAYQTQGAKYAMGGARGTQLYYNIDGISANSPAFGVQSSPPGAFDRVDGRNDVQRGQQQGGVRGSHQRNGHHQVGRKSIAWPSLRAELEYAVQCAALLRHHARAKQQQ